MIAMRFRTFITKVLFFIIIKPPLYFKIRGRHPTTDIPKQIIQLIIKKFKQSKQKFDKIIIVLFKQKKYQISIFFSFFRYLWYTY